MDLILLALAFLDLFDFDRATGQLPSSSNPHFSPDPLLNQLIESLLLGSKRDNHTEVLVLHFWGCPFSLCPHNEMIRLSVLS